MRKGKAITKLEMLTRLFDLSVEDDTERAHMEADELLLKYIDDKDISEAFLAIDRWYA